jgi:hypothetical protein
VPGRSYALRGLGRAPGGEPFVRVRYDGRIHTDQIHIRYESGDLAGLEEWVRTRHLACPWGERKVFQRDEERTARLREVSAEAGDRVVEEAISAVFTTSGEYGGFIRTWDTDPASAQRLWQRAGLEGSPLDHHPANFVDRHGMWRLTFQTAEHTAEAFAAAEPEAVDLYLRGWEEQLRAEGYLPGSHHRHELLREWAPSHALARAWSQQPRGAAAEREIQRLHDLVQEAARTHASRARPRQRGSADRARSPRSLNAGRRLHKYWCDQPWPRIPESAHFSHSPCLLVRPARPAPA